MKVLKFISLLALFSLFFGCAASTPPFRIPESKQPIDVARKNFAQFGVAKIRTNLIPGTVLGGHFDGLARFRQSNHYAHGFIDESWQNRYKRIVLEELSNCGYKVAEDSTVFETDESYASRFLVGGMILRAALNTFAPLAGNYTEAFYEIEWQVFDKETRKVVHETTTSGYSKLKGVTPDSFALAFRNCIRNYLATPGLIVALEKCTPSSDTIAERLIVTFYYNNPSIEKSSNKIGIMRKAVFAIKTEGGHGSGFVINPQGYAITNYHVIAGRNLFDAIFPDGKTIRAKVVKTIPEKDLALIKLTGEEYCYLPLGTLTSAYIGREVYAIGSPLSLGLSHSVSKGIISGIRKLKPVTLLQTDAAVNPGNSGGPLVASNGLALGVITMKVSKFGVEGIGFAISSDDIINSLGLRIAGVR